MTDIDITLDADGYHYEQVLDDHTLYCCQECQFVALGEDFIDGVCRCGGEIIVEVSDEQT